MIPIFILHSELFVSVMKYDNIIIIDIDIVMNHCKLCYIGILIYSYNIVYDISCMVNYYRYYSELSELLSIIYTSIAGLCPAMAPACITSSRMAMPALVAELWIAG